MFRKFKKAETESKGVVLLVDDNNQNLKVLSRVLESGGYEIALANEASQMFEYLDTEIPDVILLDIMLPDMDGYTACSKLKAIDRWREIPVIFLTALTGTRNMMEGYKCGGADFITKPFENVEVLARVGTQVERIQAKRENQNLKEMNARQKAIIEHQNDLLDRMAIRDELTLLVNREYAEQQLENEMARFKRTGQIFSIAICSVEKRAYIKEIHGKEAMDGIYKHLATHMMDRKRKQDIVARWDENTYLIIMPHTDLQGAQTFSERLCVSIASMAYQHEGRSIALRVSIGVAEYNQQMSMEALMHRVNNALESSIEAGGNQVVTDARYATELE